MSTGGKGTKLDLERIVFIGRTFEEYVAMFSLTKQELLGKKILDCPAGACSFTAIGNQSGLDVTACDTAYDHEIQALKAKGFQDIKHTMEQMEKAKSNFKWNYFRNVEELRKHRLSALIDCTNDMTKSSERYIPVVLPTLPFKDEEFDIVLSAHFLFMYSDWLDYDFHIKTISELLRVTKQEIRIFPLVDLTGQRSLHIDPIIQFLNEEGCSVEEVRVSYEFQTNANSMLRIKKGKTD